LKGDFQETKYLDQTALKLEVEPNIATLVLLEINAKNLKLTVNLGEGTIDSAYVKNFTSFSNEGQLIVQITNTGELAAEFICEFSCDPKVVPIPSKKLFLDSSNSTSTIQVPINTEKTENTSYYCNLTLKDNIGDILDTYKLNFSTSTLQRDSLQNTSFYSSPDLTTTSNEDICETECHGIFAFWCNLKNKCWVSFALNVAKICTILVLKIFFISRLNPSIDASMFDIYDM